MRPYEEFIGHIVEARRIEEKSGNSVNYRLVMSVKEWMFSSVMMRTVDLKGERKSIIISQSADFRQGLWVTTQSGAYRVRLLTVPTHVDVSDVNP